MSNVVFQDGSPNARSTRNLQRFYLERLRRMVALRREQTPLAGSMEVDLRLLDRAVYSTFCGCLDLGAGDEARAILRQENPTPREKRA